MISWMDKIIMHALKNVSVFVLILVHVFTTDNLSKGYPRNT